MDKHPNFSLKKKTAIVTGSVGILGKDFCRALAQYGANIVALDLNQKHCEELAGNLEHDFGIQALGLFCDVSNPASVEQALAKSIEKFKSIEILHNNAATKTNNLDAFLAPFEDYNLDVWKEVMSVNLDGMFLMAQAVGKHMLEQKIKGSIIQTASIYGVVAPDQRIYKGSYYMGRDINTPAVYSVSKAGVIGLSNYLASYWGSHGIRVNTLTPGGVESGQNDIFRENYSKRIPMGRMAQASEMLGALVFLASDASSYITGQNIIVDGGLTVW